MEYRWLYLGIVLALVISETSGQHNLAWLAPEQIFSQVQASSSMGGLVLGIENVVASGGSLTGETFTVKWKDSGCSSKTSLISVYQILRQDGFLPDVVIGPVCSDAMAHVAQLAGYRDIPIIGWHSDSADFSQKTQYNTFIRTLPPINTIGRALVETLVNLDWSLVFIITAEGDFAQLGEGVSDAIDSTTAVNYTRNYDNVNQNITDNEVQEIYNILKKEARIVILCIPRSDLRTWMLNAEKAGMTNGDYAFIFVNKELPTAEVYQQMTSDSLWKRGDGEDDRAEKAFRSLLTFTMETLNESVIGQFYQDADSTANQNTWQTMLGLTPSPSDEYSPYLHDAVRLYGTLVKEARDKGLNYTSGSVLLDLAKNREYTGPDWVSGTMILDENGDRFPVFYLLDMAPEGNFRIVQKTTPDFQSGSFVLIITDEEDIIWGNGKTGDANKPESIPDCGFRNENCPDLTLYIALPVTLVLLILIALIIFCVCRKYQFEKSLNDMVWKINGDELAFISKDSPGSAYLRMSRGSRHSAFSAGRKQSIRGSALLRKSLTNVTKADTLSIGSHDEAQVFIDTAKFKGDVVAVKKVRKQRVKLDRALMVEMRTMTNLKHANLAVFTGACIEPENLLEVWEYCSKGSLQDVIWNENFKLDLMFKFSMAADTLKGLKYLHGSALKVHGRLKSSNVVVDGRCQCKLSDYGLQKFRDGQEIDEDMSEFKKYSQLFWTAPELLSKLSKSGAVTMATQSGDIYAAAVIIKEIFANNGPYTEITDTEDLTPREIIEKVKKKEGRGPFRPSLVEVKREAPDGMAKMIQQAWCEDPTARPSASGLLRDLQRHNPSKSTNVMNNMIDMMEKYSNNLEELVGERTQQVEEEKKKSENLLFRMLPKPIAEELKLGRQVKAESFEAVTIYFSDIVKFTNLSAASTPMQVVDLLNSLYTVFDSAIAQHDVYKVETIGDAYMIVSGLPVRNGDNHAVEVANAAMDLLTGISACKVPHMPDYVLRIRIGLHTGPVVAGVVGLSMPRYCLFGNTVNVASQFESGGSPMRIHLSETTYKILSKFRGYHLADRGSSLDCKKSGKLHSYWLFGREGRDKPLPDFQELAKEDDPPAKILPVTKGREFRSSVSRPSQESGIFDVDNDEQKSSRKTSNTDAVKLEGIKETSNENMQGTANAPNTDLHNEPEMQKGNDAKDQSANQNGGKTNDRPPSAIFVPSRSQKKNFDPSTAPVGLKREKTLEVQDFEDFDNESEVKGHDDQSSEAQQSNETS